MKLVLLLPFFCFSQNYSHVSESISRKVSVIKTPEHFFRSKSDTNSFSHWLRNFPLKSQFSKVLYFNDEPKYDQSIHHNILDIDVGSKNLQQCADAVMRLRAEYLYSIKDFENIHFNFTSGHKFSYIMWREGFRPKVNGNKVTFLRSASKNHTYKSFRKYLNIIFTYAGTYSLKKELKKVHSISDIKIGDIFIQGGFPGHAMIVMDLIENKEKTKKHFLLAQSYMPAQSIHIVNNFNDEVISPWYSANTINPIQTPEWTFELTDLYRFK